MHDFGHQVPLNLGVLYGINPPVWTTLRERYPPGGWGGYTPGTAAIIERRGFTQYTRKVVRTRAKSALELS
jgi:hypothetical protein